eukprot:scaffold11705_cov168-Skeletonema_dohrnii-CCMP3373.AAC.2
MPAIVRWKGGGVPEGETSSEVVSALDVLPTVLSMIGKDIPNGSEVDGIDVTDVFVVIIAVTERGLGLVASISIQCLQLSNGSKVDDAACSLDARCERCLTM